MRTVEELLQTALSRSAPLAPIELSVRDARGCVLAADVISAVDVPTADVAIFDGYALAAESLDSALSSPVTLSVIDDVAAGFTAQRSVQIGEAVAVARNVVLPDGCDAVVGLDAVEQLDGEVAVGSGITPGSGIRNAGAVLSQGSPVLAAGTLLGEREVAALAAAGCSRVLVHPRPRVVVITVGNDLVDIGRPVQAGLEPDATSALLMGCASRAGADAFRGGPIPQDSGALAQAIQDQLVRADVVVVSRSMGIDVGPALEQADCRDVDYCAIDPGGSLGVGVVGEDSIPLVVLDRSVLGAFIGFEIVVRPVISALAGRSSLFRPVLRARATESAHSPLGTRSFLPAVAQLREGAVVEVAITAGLPESAAFWLHESNALMIIPEAIAEVNPGDELATIRLDRE